MNNITHEEDGESQWFLTIEDKKFLIEFIVTENIIQQGYVIMHPVDNAHFEPSVIQLSVSIEDSLVEDEDGDWLRVRLTQDEEKNITNYIESNYEI